jgi:hypothetical protein
MTRTASAKTRVATGVASGNLGTGTAVDDETTLMAVPEPPPNEPTPAPEAPVDSKAVVAPSPIARPTPARRPAQAAEPVLPSPSRTSPGRRDPYRPIGIALAAVLVTLAGVAVLSSGGGTPAQIAAPPAATEVAPTSPDGAGEEGEGNGDGRGNCNGHGNDPCDREGGGGD